MRLRALDIVRGLAVCGMILVNNPGDLDAAPRQLCHAGWYGLTFADTVAPAFLWVVGFAMTLSIARRLAGGAARVSLRRHVLVRAARLFAVGVGLHLFAALFPGLDFSHLDDIALMGILQRIAAAYGVAAFLLFAGLPAGRTAVALLAGYLGVLLAGVPTSSLAVAFARETNVASWIDGVLLGSHGSAAHTLLSVVPATATVLLGAAAAQASTRDGRLALDWRFALVHVVSPLAGGALLSLVMPLTRYLWSPNFALLTAGITAATLLVVHGLLEGRDRRLAPIVAIGANPLALFVLSELGRMVLSTFGLTASDGTWRSFWAWGDVLVARGLPPGAASVVFSAAYLAAMVGVAVAMQRRHLRIVL